MYPKGISLRLAFSISTVLGLNLLTLPAQADCYLICNKVGGEVLRQLCWSGWRSRSDIPLPPSTSDQTLYFDNVPIPPNALKGIDGPSTHAINGYNIGFRFTGAFYTSGAGTSDNWSHSAVYWHDRADSLGFEY